MYVPFVLATLVILPVASIGIDLMLHPGTALVLLVGRWFVFWAVGVRLFAAGIKQMAQPEFTARQIFKMKTDEALPVVRELGMGNLSGGLVGLASILMPGFVLPAALYGAVFYGLAGFGHIAQPDRSLNENVALWTDLFIAAVLLVFVLWSLIG